MKLPYSWLGVFILCFAALFLNTTNLPKSISLQEPSVTPTLSIDINNQHLYYDHLEGSIGSGVTFSLSSISAQDVSFTLNLEGSANIVQDYLINNVSSGQPLQSNHIVIPAGASQASLIFMSFPHPSFAHDVLKEIHFSITDVSNAQHNRQRNILYLHPDRPRKITSNKIIRESKKDGRGKGGNPLQKNNSLQQMWMYPTPLPRISLGVENKIHQEEDTPDIAIPNTTELAHAILSIGIDQVSSDDVTFTLYNPTTLPWFTSPSVYSVSPSITLDGYMEESADYRIYDSNGDIVNLWTELTIPAGEQTLEFYIQVYNDSLDEGLEAQLFSLHNIQNAYPQAVNVWTGIPHMVSDDDEVEETFFAMKIDSGNYFACAMVARSQVDYDTEVIGPNFQILPPYLRLFCWGSNEQGQLGQGAVSNGESTPIEVPLPPGEEMWDLSILSLGSFHVCASVSSGNVYCWGDNQVGAIGNGTTGGIASSPTLLPVPTGSTHWTEIAAGADQTCGITNTNQLYCWGSDNSGQLGNGLGNNPQNSPSLVTNPPGVTGWNEVSGRGHHICARASVSNQVYCWGSNTFAQLGDGTLTMKELPTLISALPPSSTSTLSTSVTATCEINTDDQSLSCWGLHILGSTSLTPTPIPSPSTGWELVDLGAFHKCIQTSGTSQLYCWGNDQHGQLGDGPIVPPQNELAQVQTSLLPAITEPFSQIALGALFSCAMSSEMIEQNVFCWGSNEEGQLGNGGPATVDENIPVQVVFE